VAASRRRGISDPALEEQAAQWPAWAPSGLVNLGLDLRGGAHLLAEVQVAMSTSRRMDGLWPEVRDALAASATRWVQRHAEESRACRDELRVRISNPDRHETARWNRARAGASRSSR
jgi:preprotein translocase subunit SecD